MHAFHCFMLLHAQSRSLCEYVYLNSIYDYMHRGVSKSNVLLLFVGTSSYIWHVLLHMWMYQLYIALHHITLHVHVHLHYITYIPTYIHTHIHTYIHPYIHIYIHTYIHLRGVGCGRPEPWTRLHCSELHWCEPVALSAGQSGAPVSSKACAHGLWVSFSNQRLLRWPTHRESGVYSGFPGWPLAFAMLQCTAGTLLRRRHSGSTWTVLQIFFSLAPSRQRMFWWWVYSYGKHVVRHNNLVLPCLIVPGTFSLLTWHGSHVHPETHKFLVAGDGWSLTWPCVTALS